MKVKRPIATRMELRIIYKKLAAMYGFKFKHEKGKVGSSKQILSDARKVFYAASLALTTYSKREILGHVGIAGEQAPHYDGKINSSDVGLRLAINQAFKYLKVEQRLSYEKELQQGKRALLFCEKVKAKIDLSAFPDLRKELEGIIEG